jgi:hypothetical protein
MSIQLRNAVNVHLDMAVPYLQLEGSTTPAAPAAPEPAGPAKTKTAGDKTDKEALM